MTRRVLLIINGRPRVGKDTATENFRVFAEHHNIRHGFTSSIDPVRDILRAAGHPVDRKGPRERKLLSQVGDALEEYDQVKTQHVCRSACAFFRGTYRSLYLTHVREPAMINRIKLQAWDKEGVDVLTLLVTGPRGEHHDNPADRSVDQVAYDHTLTNSGTLEDFRVECYQFIAPIFGGIPKEG